MLRYKSKISGPLLDRIDLHVEVLNLKDSTLLDETPSGESSDVVGARVAKARARQLERSNKPNSQLQEKEITAYCELKDKDKTLLQSAMLKLGLSARSVNRIRKVARTIADLENSKKIETSHLSEAISYRRLDRGSL